MAVGLRRERITSSTTFMEIDNRYWAGLFDGEGNINFSKDLKHMRVNVTQKEPLILQLIKNRFGGTIAKYRCHTCHRWFANNKDQMLNFLESISPYVIIKAVEVQCSIEALKGFRNSKWNGGGMNRKLDPEELDRRQVLRDKLMADRKDEKQVLTPEEYKHS